MFGAGRESLDIYSGPETCTDLFPLPLKAASWSCKMKTQNFCARLPSNLKVARRQQKRSKEDCTDMSVYVGRQTLPRPIHLQRHILHIPYLSKTHIARDPLPKKRKLQALKTKLSRETPFKRCTFTQLLCFYLFLFFSPLLPASLISTVLSFVLLSSSLLSSRLLSLGKFL